MDRDRSAGAHSILSESDLPPPHNSVVSGLGDNTSGTRVEGRRRSRRRGGAGHTVDEQHTVTSDSGSHVSRPSRSSLARQWRGYASSEAGLMEDDDPPPTYASRPPTTAPTANVPPDDIVPSDSASNVSVPFVPVFDVDSRSERSTRSTVSLSDSSVDRLANRLADITVARAADRVNVPTMPARASTSARRPRDPGGGLKRVDALTGAARILFGGSRVYEKRDKTLVLVKPKGRSTLHRIPE